MKSTKNAAREIKQRRVSDLVPYAGNAKQHPKEQIKQLKKSIDRFGFCQPVLIDDNNEIIAGHGRVMAAEGLGLVTIPVIVLDYLSPEEQRAYVIADNKIAERGKWDNDMLSLELAELTALNVDLDGLGFTDKALSKLLEGLDIPDIGGKRAEEAETPAGDPGDEIPSEPLQPVSRSGDIWLLGRHRVMCGSSTDSDAVELLLDGVALDGLLTDPPYSSGGFQEAGRSSGSIGTNRSDGRPIPKIANDRLSTRGYQALISSILTGWPARVVHVFTDWKMWVYLYDVVETNGYQVKSQIVWDKLYPGMGVGWRAQHELVMCGVGASFKFNMKHGHGNVITCKRSGNPLHPTQKPLELIEKILGVIPDCKIIGEPFGGSGTTLIACEKLERSCYAMELSPGFIDVIVERWQTFTGEAAVLARSGQSFAEVTEERREVS